MATHSDLKKCLYISVGVSPTYSRVNSTSHTKRNLGVRGILIAPAESAECPDGCGLVSDDWQLIARHILSSDRVATVERDTSETRISVTLDLDGHLPSAIDSGLKFFDHMLWQLPHHAGISLDLSCKGDLEVDEHHTMEDVAIALGQAIDTALGSKRGIDRYGFVLPMDECKAMVLIDFGGRADFVWDVEFTREYVQSVCREHRGCVQARCRSDGRLSQNCLQDHSCRRYIG